MRKPAVSLDDLEVVYQWWPTPEYDKARLRALLLRIRIERLVEALPRTVVKRPDSRRVAHRLLLAVGEPGLSDRERARRHGIVTAAVAAYEAACDLLHGRTPEPNPPVQDVKAWSVAVTALEWEFSARAAISSPPRAATAGPSPRR